MDANNVIKELGSAFEEFKKANDQKIEQLATKGHVDSLLEAKLANLNAAMDSLEAVKGRLDKVEADRQKVSAAGDMDKTKDEHKAAFANYLRKGKEGNLAELEAKAYATNTNAGADGGFAVPELIDRMIHDLVVEISPFRQVANNVTVSTPDYKKLVNVRGTASGWVGETDLRPETASSQFVEVPLFFGELYANPRATQTMLDDVFFNAEQWISSEIATEFAKQEGNTFLLGDGVNKPKGLLTYTATTEIDGVRAFGSVQKVQSGSNTDIGGFDKLIELVHQVKAAHRAGASFAMNKETLSTIRALKTVDGNYLWQASLQIGNPSTILGYPVVEMEDMPAIGAGNTPIVFGNMRTAYTIADRVGTRVIRDQYSAKPYIQFYTTKRLGGALIDSEAVKFLTTEVIA